ncbi:MAG: helix-turn-helix domain-containing protein [Tetrasphaera sp.]
MGRPRSFDEDDVLRSAIRLFGHRGYDGLSVDALVSELGISRASLYKIYGSKYGLLRASVTNILSRRSRDDRAKDLTLVALLELAPTDESIRALCAQAIDNCFDADPAKIGTHLARRAGLLLPE